MDIHEVLFQLAVLRTLMDVNPDYGMGLSEEDCRKYVTWVDKAIKLINEQDPTVMLYGSKITGEIPKSDIANRPRHIEEV